ncbi:methanogenesis marker 16 metalloprotein [Methanolobus halotolerans]|uniref:Methanogenesis marker 16 metalloprotein n=1 Tax=Methanolobus halotolerans TaxID=2052935 RepID=A0A4E0PZC5_9EURY|nr:methanogenesis marker 16 metalloprotein [Methanolobus halotolerans]TGC10993.1 methanogenesis marker 16 metalloprotein [Methanolobus halotolerans]
MERSTEDIQKKIAEKTAIVMTSQEVCELIEKGEEVTAKDVDIVTTATRAIMSGTYALLSFPVNSAHSFKRASKVFLNGVPAHVGPCPNESLGMLDLMVFGTAHSCLEHDYGGGHLFRDMVDRKIIDISVITDEEDSFQTTVTLDKIPYAKIHATRHSFRNYAAFVNCSGKPVSTIFHATEFEPDMKTATFSGCGQINPLKNDPGLTTIGVGTRVLMNGAEGFVLGEGTRSSPERPNLTGFADMHTMDPQLMGGFTTSAGPECIVSWAIPIPVVNDSVLDAIIKTDHQVPMPVMDVDRRTTISGTTYADGWHNVDLSVEFRPASCIRCDVCRAADNCPMEAIYFKNERIVLDRHLCFNCGLCSTICPEGVFRAELGSIRFETEGRTNEVPIVLRQSDRKRALELEEKLKGMILDGTFRLSRMVEKLRP